MAWSSFNQNLIATRFVVGQGQVATGKSDPHQQKGQTIEKEVRKDNTVSWTAREIA